MRRSARYGSLALIASVCASALVHQSVAADAGIARPRVVSTNPAGFTPNLRGDATISHPAVYSFAPATTGTQMYVGGQFHSLQDAGRTRSFVRTDVAAFDRLTGVVSPSFHPVLDGSVWGIVSSGPAVFLAGEFTHVDGVARRGLVRLDQSGAVDTAFNPRATLPSGVAFDLQMVDGRLVVGGSFPKRLAALDPATGADTGYLRLGITGTVAVLGPTVTHVARFAVSPDHSHLVAVGNFSTVSGHARARAFMLDLGPSQGVLGGWYYPQLTHLCNVRKLAAYLQDVAFSPDSSYFVMVSTGHVPVKGGLGTDLCDAAARFESAVPHPNRPTWINYTGGDTLHSVAISSTTVYVQGHNRWLDNPLGSDTCRTTCVSRPGIGAIDPVSGKALPWNPTKGRGVGGKVLLLTGQGLWVGSDTKLIHNEFHYGIALMPL